MKSKEPLNSKDSSKSDISLICFWLVVVLFAIPAIDFYYNYFNK